MLIFHMKELTKIKKGFNTIVFENAKILGRSKNGEKKGMALDNLELLWHKSCNVVPVGYSHSTTLLWYSHFYIWSYMVQLTGSDP